MEGLRLLDEAQRDGVGEETSSAVASGDNSASAGVASMDSPSAGVDAGRGRAAEEEDDVLLDN
jgi:hypothetical protein